MIYKKLSTIVVSLCIAVVIGEASEYDKYILKRFDFSPAEYGFVKYQVETVIPEHYEYRLRAPIKVSEQVKTEECYALVKRADALSFAASGFVVVEGNNQKTTYTFINNSPKGGYFIIPINAQDAMPISFREIGDLRGTVFERIPNFAQALCMEQGKEPWIPIPNTMDANIKVVSPLRAGKTVKYENLTINGAINDPLYQQNKKVVEQFFDEDADIELGKIGGGWVAVVGMGKKKTLFAMFGIWETNKALQYGYQVGEAVYPSENLEAEDCPALFGLGVTSEKDIGNRCFSYKEVIANPEQMYPLLVWREELLTSKGNLITGEKKQYTNTEPNILKPTKLGNYYPPAPDILDNTNPAVLRDCPDKDYYWQLFCECADKKLGDAGSRDVKPEQFYSYKDFMEIGLMKDGYDYSVYNKSGAFSSQVATEENPPAEPYLFNKDCQLLNGGTTMPFMAPWRAGRATLLGRRIGEADFNFFDIVAPGLAELQRVQLDNMWIKSGVLGYVQNALKRVNTNIYPFVNSTNGIRQLEKKSVSMFGEAKATSYAEKIYSLMESGGQNIAVWKTDMEGIERNDEIILIHKTGNQDSDKESELYVANPFDQNRPYQIDKYFSSFDLNMSRYGQPLRTFAFHKEEAGAAEAYVFVQNDKKVWYIQWRWQIITLNEYGMPLTYGYLIVLEKLFEEEDQLLAPGQVQEFNFIQAESKKPGDFDGNEFRQSFYGGTSDANPIGNLNPRGGYDITIHFLEQRKRNEFIYIQSPFETDLPDWAQYLKNSKDYHTDQYDISERDESLEKGEALKEIALKIAVSEGLNMVMRGIHYVAQEQNGNWVGKAASAAFETGKRIENRLTHSKTGEIAKYVYEAYIFWKRTMDVCNDLKNTYQSINDAWDGLLYSIHHLKDYYENFDLKSLRLTNITSLYPRGMWAMLDWNIYRLQAALSDHGKAQWAMAYQIDRVSKGNYGPLVPVINDVTVELIEAQMAIGEQTDKDMEVLESRIDALEKGYGDNNRERAKLSNLTREAHNLLVCKGWKVRNQGTDALAQALWLTEYEAKDWVTLGAWTQETFGLHKDERREQLADAMLEARKQKNALPILMQFNTPQLFSRVRGIHIQNMATK
jgi:hypothetical protein